MAGRVLGCSMLGMLAELPALADDWSVGAMFASADVDPGAAPEVRGLESA